VCVCVCVCVCVYVRKSSAVFMLLFVLIMQFHSGFVRQIELVRTEHKRTELLRVDSFDDENILLNAFGSGDFDQSLFSVFAEDTFPQGTY
jgi:hypothetical protein